MFRRLNVWYKSHFGTEEEIDAYRLLKAQADDRERFGPVKLPHEDLLNEELRKLRRQVRYWKNKSADQDVEITALRTRDP